MKLKKKKRQTECNISIRFVVDGLKNKVAEKGYAQVKYPTVLIYSTWVHVECRKWHG